MAESRSAHHTIAGYHYQFDKSILEILRANPRAAVMLEGVEDVDVDEHCIQVKYHAAQRYIRSAIRKPLMDFLKNNETNPGKRRYTLYAHFGDPGSFKAIDLAELKEILANEIKTLALSDLKLRAFLKNQFKYEAADDIDKQRENVLAQLGKSLRATPVDCEQYYYNNALHEVMRLSRQPTDKARTTTRAAFIIAINKKDAIFSRWLAQFNGQKDYRKHVHGELAAADALRSSKKRFVFLGQDILPGLSCSDIAAFCRTLADRHFELGKVLKDAVPFTVIVDRARDDVTEVQRQLLEWGIHLNTGYEAVVFQPGMFNEAPIINRKAVSGGKASDKVSKASHRLCLISAATYSAHKDQIDVPDTLIVAGDVPASKLTPRAGAQVFRITDVDGLMSLARILEK